MKHDTAPGDPVEPQPGPSIPARVLNGLIGLFLLLLPVLHSTMILLPWIALRNFVSLPALFLPLVTLIGWALHISLLNVLHSIGEDRNVQTVMKAYLASSMLPYLAVVTAMVYALLSPGRITMFDLPMAFLNLLIASFVLLRWTFSRLTPLFRKRADR
jgi:hypothetical protein